MYKIIFRQSLLFLCLLELTIAPQNSVEAATLTERVVGVSSGQAGGFIRPPQLVVSLDQAAQSLKVAGSGGSKFMLVDSNEDGKADSIVPAPQGAIEAVSLDQAVSTLKGLGGTSKSYMAVDTNGDGRADSIVAVTY